MNKTFITLIKALLFAVLFLTFIPAQSQGVDEQYKQAIESADNYFDKADYLNAKASYQVAAQLKPDEQYPKDRLKESIGLLRVQMEKMADYNDKLAYADRLYREKSWENAILAYEEAQKIMPSDPYPSEQVKLIRQNQSDQAENESRYAGLLKQGDDLFAATNYQAAIDKYDDAAAIYPDRQEVKDKVSAANQKLADIAAQQSGYEKAISEAEMYHARKDYENELISYQLALELKPEEALPQVKIRELNDFLRKYEAYNKYVSEGDELYISQQFAEARVKYEAALEILPDENYPREIISKINVALSEKTERDKVAYEDAIAMADELYSQEDYQAAMLAYSDALRFWPDGEHAHQRLSSINEIMALKKAKEEAYANTITLADKLFANKEYAEAKAEYRKAADINPFEQYPKVRIDEIEVILAEYQNLLDQYDAIIQGADKLFNAGDYSESRIQYLKAQDIMSERSYPEDQIKMIDEILGLAVATREAYDAAIARGDEHFAKREWEDAKVDFVEANDLIQEEQYPKDKISEINNIMAQLQAEQETYTLALKTADQLLADNDYNGALLEYRKAEGIFQDEEYPKQKIEEINGILAEQARLAGIDQSYSNAVAEGDRLLAEEQYDAAKASYGLALTFKADEAYPKEKITEIDALLVELARLQGVEDSYNEAIAAADLAMGQSDYTKARSDYELAMGIKPDEQYPKDKIAEIDAIFAAEAARIAQLGADYSQAITDGDALFAAQDYEGSKAKFNAALALMSDETYPAQKISEIDGILAELERIRLLDEQYAASIASADGMFDEEAYGNAKAEYEKASGLKPEETYPKDKIAEIDAIFAEQARLEGIDESYAEAIASADAFMADNQLNEAKAEYQRALTIKPEEAYPQQKISEIDAIFAAEAARIAQLGADYTQAITDGDALFAAEDYEGAKVKFNAALALMPDEAYPSQKITEIDGILAELERLRLLNEEYTATIASADGMFNEESYTNARAEYEKASGRKPEETYPKDKIAEIDAIFTEQARLQGIEESYNEAIAAADAFMSGEQLAEAKAEYQKALTFKPDEVYPQQKIREIDGVFASLAEQEEQYLIAIGTADNYFNTQEYEQAREAYVRAQGIKAEEPYPAQRITEIDNILANLEQQRLIDESYANAIAHGDNFFGDKEYTQARAKYEEALTFKADQPYPKEKIAEIDAIFAASEELEENYNNAIAAADEAFTSANYDEAISSYNAALGFKPNEEYPANKIAEINAIVAEIAAQKKAIEDSYTEAIGNGDDFFNRGDFMNALQSYTAASEIKPEEAYPKQRITEINSRMEELQEERIKAYNAAIVQADNYYNMANYRMAKASYQTAVDIKSDEQYARDRLDEVTVIYMAELESLKVEYRKYIADADNYFNGKIYDGAIENYRTAASILPDEAYPGQMIARITKIINDNAITDVNKLAQVIPNNTDRRFSFNELPVNVRKENYILIKARNVSGHDFKMLVNFGKDNTKNGGIVLQVPEGETSKDYIIRIGALYKWFSEDNNWLGIYPEGGDIEIALIRISKSD